MRERIKKIMAELFNVNIETIPDEATIKEIENWDSLNHIKLIMEIENEFNIKFDTEVIPELNSLEKIINEIEFHRK